MGLSSKQSANRILIVTAVSTERDAVLRGLDDAPGFDVIAAGVGPIAAATQTAIALNTTNYDLVIIAGIGGGFAGRSEVGALVLADEIIAADLGAQTQDGFSSLDKLGYGPTRFKVDDELVRKVYDGLLKADQSVQIGPILTVSTATGTSATAAELASRVPGAMAEAMEGFGAATAANALGVSYMELRAISNLVGPRNLSAWRIDEALNILQNASAVLPNVLL